MELAVARPLRLYGRCQDQQRAEYPRSQLGVLCTRGRESTTWAQIRGAAGWFIYRHTRLVLPTSQTARGAVNAIANKAGIPSWYIDEYVTIGNALSALKTADSLDLYEAWWEQYRRSDEVPDDVVIPDGEWPIIEMRLFKSLLRNAEV